MPLQSVVKRPASLGLAVLVLSACAGSAQLPGNGPAQAAPARPDSALIAKGANLAAIGNCRGCHTAEDGPALGGGVPLTTPFGTIHGTNISPDPATGIGRWSEADFTRAMREGLDRGGQHLYPAFPYDHFTRVTDEDNRALYAYLMAQPPVVHTPPPNTLAFPFNVRSSIAVWNRLYLEPGPKAPTQSDPVLARGEYLVEGLGHCGACHTPRNAMQAEKKDRPYAGGELEGWHAYAINRDNAAPVPWTVDALTDYLQHGYAERHGISRGSMGMVTAELAYADAKDVRAMAAYVVGLMAGRASPSVDLRQGLPSNAFVAGGKDEGARLYGTTCGGCHDGSTPLPWGGMPLAWSIGVAGESPRNLINVILHGIPPEAGDRPSPQMPGFSGALNDAQVETLVQWLRANLTDRAPWSDVKGAIRASRAMTAAQNRFPPGGSGADPARTARQSP